MKNHRLQLTVIFALLIILVISATGVAAAPKAGPDVKISTAQGKFSSTQDVIVTVTISNPTGSSVRILKWFTPADGVEEPLFSVKRNGESISYIGAIYKRPAATGSDYITLKAGQSISYNVNLGEFYDLSQSGNYEISYAVSSYNLYNEKGNGFKFQDSLVSGSISLKVDGRVGKGKATPPPPPPGGNSYNACTTEQQTQLVAARNQAKTYASESESYLIKNKSSTNRYVTWFGIFDGTRFATVLTHFTSLSNAWDTAGVTFYCNCKQPYYAYVYPNQPYNIYVCKYFWLAPMTGTDSKGGTLIHEMSHFYKVASTDDFVYGQSGAMNLALTNPDNAIMNADNHEYFAENNP
jgi:peptidyl-Lys metalloendopeptidase